MECGQSPWATFSRGFNNGDERCGSRLVTLVKRLMFSNQLCERNQGSNFFEKIYEYVDTDY